MRNSKPASTVPILRTRLLSTLPRTTRLQARFGLGLAPAVLLSGCIAIDFPVKGAVFINRTDEAVLVHFEGTDRTAVVKPGHHGIPETECLGAGLVVTTAGGEELASFDGAACEETTLEVYENGSVTVTDTWGSEETRAPRP